MMQRILLRQKKSGLGSKKTSSKIKNNEDENFIINFKFKGVDE